jgi:hypothetical protein
MDEKAVRKVEVVEDETLKCLKKLWSSTPLSASSIRLSAHSYIHSGEYTTLLSESDLFKKLSYSAKDIEKFSLILPVFQEKKHFSKKAGLFLSFLINNCSDSDYVIHTIHLSVDMAFLGYKNTKKVTIKGDGGEDLGCEMQEGSIIVEGNSANNTGLWMNGGSIVVRGNAGPWLGSLMQGGMITIEGNADAGIGDEMGGGKIRVLGEFGRISQHFSGGKIYHKRKLMASK